MQIIAHRGASGYTTENTIDSALKAIDLNTDAIEIDIQPTSDNHIVVFHDKTTQRLTNKNFIISETTFNDLSKLKVNDSHNIPELSDILKLLPPDINLFIEIKEYSEIDYPIFISVLKNEIERSEKQKQCIIISFSIDILIFIKNVMPEVICYIVADELHNIEKTIQLCKKYNFEGLDLKSSMITSDIVDKLRANNLNIFAWTVNSQDETQRLKSLDIDGITTDFPDLIRAYTESK